MRTYKGKKKLKTIFLYATFEDYRKKNEQRLSRGVPKLVRQEVHREIKTKIHEAFHEEEQVILRKQLLAGMSDVSMLMHPCVLTGAYDNVITIAPLNQVHMYAYG